MQKKHNRKQDKPSCTSINLRIPLQYKAENHKHIIIHSVANEIKTKVKIEKAPVLITNAIGEDQVRKFLHHSNCT